MPLMQFKVSNLRLFTPESFLLKHDFAGVVGESVAVVVHRRRLVVGLIIFKGKG